MLSKNALVYAFSVHNAAQYQVTAIHTIPNCSRFPFCYISFVSFHLASFLLYLYLPFFLIPTSPLQTDCWPNDQSHKQKKSPQKELHFIPALFLLAHPFLPLLYSIVVTSCIRYLFIFFAVEMRLDRWGI